MEIKRIIKNQSGLTLVELLSVIVVLGIIFSIALISLGGIKEEVEGDVCAVNRVEVKRQYGVHLSLENVEHIEMFLLVI
jgi:prepilin-type N-terminal cleavage/methylation domain-containing protein